MSDSAVGESAGLECVAILETGGQECVECGIRSEDSEERRQDIKGLSDQRLFHLILHAGHLRMSETINKLVLAIEVFLLVPEHIY